MKNNSSFPSPDNWLPHRVSYGETDAMGWVYYGNYFELFERGRGEYIRTLTGMSYFDVEERGILLPVREASCRYRAPARYDELIMIRTGIQEWGRASMTFVYEVYNETKEKMLASGMTQHACVNRNSKPVRVPEWLIEAFGNVNE
ncbi:MAG: acyl-CoA thioesterase [Desulfovibrio sp.]|nr:MAG: acyl-CoA thioesterase [Desulfovibrio sp.]